jgi:hypothetical protein
MLILLNELSSQWIYEARQAPLEAALMRPRRCYPAAGSSSSEATT